jgi:hypothetical protein
MLNVCADRGATKGIPRVFALAIPLLYRGTQLNACIQNCLAPNDLNAEPSQILVQRKNFSETLDFCWDESLQSARSNITVATWAVDDRCNFARSSATLGSLKTTGESSALQCLLGLQSHAAYADEIWTLSSFRKI